MIDVSTKKQYEINQRAKEDVNKKLSGWDKESGCFSLGAKHNWPGQASR